MSYFSNVDLDVHATVVISHTHRSWPLLTLLLSYVHIPIAIQHMPKSRMMEDAVIHHPSFHQVSLILEVNHRIFLQKIAKEVLTPEFFQFRLYKRA